MSRLVAAPAPGLRVHALNTLDCASAMVRSSWKHWLILSAIIALGASGASPVARPVLLGLMVVMVVVSPLVFGGAMANSLRKEPRPPPDGA